MPETTQATEYVAWWHGGYIHEDQKPVLEDKETERVENEDGLFIFFDNEEEARAAADDLIVVAVPLDERESIDRDTLYTGDKL